MKIQEIISSGKLELYVAGALSEREMSDIASYALESQEVAGEIERIERAMIDFLGTAAFTLSSEEKEAQITSLFHRFHEGGEDAHPVKNGKLIRISKLSLAAIITGLTLLTGFAVWSGVNSMELQHHVAAVSEKDHELMAENEMYKDKLSHMEQQVGLMRNIITRRVELTSVKGNPIIFQGSYMLVYWNPQTKKLLVVDAHLPELSKDQQYQLWALNDGKPIDAGIFDYKNLQVKAIFQKDILNAQAFAVTVEPKGGSPSPTFSKLCMMGKL